MRPRRSRDRAWHHPLERVWCTSIRSWLLLRSSQLRIRRLRGVNKLMQRSTWKVNSPKFAFIESRKFAQPRPGTPWLSLATSGYLRGLSDLPWLPNNAHRGWPRVSGHSPPGYSARPCNTRAQMRQPNAAEDATARAMFHRTQRAEEDDEEPGVEYRHIDLLHGADERAVGGPAQAEHDRVGIGVIEARHEPCG